MTFDALMAWMMASLDGSRAHAVTGAVAWHGRLMVLTWAVLFPLGVLVARFGKITPRQAWPTELDNKTWWIAHLVLQIGGGVCLLVGVSVMVAAQGGFAAPGRHTIAGWCVVIGTVAQLIGGVFRGSKGGPTDPAADGSRTGDHYDMTRRRKVFEFAHKAIGYASLALAAYVIWTGLWLANGPRWMWYALIVWWGGLLAAGIVLQASGRAVDTYQAIWGPDLEHPGNRLPPPGWGMRRPPKPGSTTD
jgi:hypothetical protein